jgi:hypothetical protein
LVRPPSAIRSLLDQHRDGCNKPLGSLDGHRGVFAGNPVRRPVSVICERFEIVRVGQELREGRIEQPLVFRQPREDGAKTAVGLDRAPRPFVNECLGRVERCELGLTRRHVGDLQAVDRLRIG